jgi:holo-[acyl-carrier protein] synthase
VPKNPGLDRNPMILSIGIDIIEISRVEEVLKRQGKRFRARVFTDEEVRYCESRASRVSSYAARFAAKEAVMKALGTGWSRGVRWRDIEIVRARYGPPSIRLSGRALERFAEIGAARISLSLTHSRDLAMAHVIFES